MMKHLDNRTLEFIKTATDEERIISTRNFKWIKYSQAGIILNRIEELHNYPKRDRMPNLLLVGDSNNGKTALLNHYTKKHPAYIDSETLRPICPILMIQSPPEPDEKRFYNAILDSLFAPYKTSEKIDMRYLRVKNLLVNLEIKILIIDEIHHVLAGSSSKQRSFLNVIKHLSNDLKIPLICSGTKAAFNAIQTDAQLANRFEPKVLPLWKNDIEFKRLLLSFERLLPLKKESHLIEPNLSNKILFMSEGLIGEMSKILEYATILAIKNQKENITIEILDEIDYVIPSKRKHQSLL